MKPQSVINWADCTVLQSIPGKSGDEWVFVGTSVPYSAVLDRIGRYTVNQIAAEYPSVGADKIVELLYFIADSTEPEAVPVTPPRIHWNA